MLTITPPIHPSESPAGHLLRAFEVNGVRWSRKTFSARGFSMSDVLHGQAESALSGFLRKSSSDFANTSPQTITKKTVELAGQELHRDDWTTHVRRWCPACWSEDFSRPALGRHSSWNIHRRFWWDVAAVSACPIHQLRLAERCPTCACAITWEHGSLTRCRNGHNLLACEGVAVDPGHTAADAYVLGRLQVIEKEKVQILDGLSLRQAHDAMERLGVTKLGGAKGALSKFSVDRHPEVLSTGLAIARGWPNTFSKLLDELDNAPGTVGVWGAEQLYGYLYIWAKALPKGSSGNEVRKQIFDHHAARSIVKSSSVVTRRRNAKYRTIPQLATDLGESPNVVARAVKILGRWPTETRSGSPVKIDGNTAASVHRLLKEGLMLRDLVPILGLALNQTKALVRAGIISPVGPTRAECGMRVLFDPEHVHDVLERLRASAPVLEVPPPFLGPLPKVCRTACTDGVVGACSAILSGELVPRAVAKDAVGVAGILIDPADLRQLRRRRSGDGYTLEEAGRQIFVSSDVVGLLAKAGFLITRSAGKELLVDKDSLKSFDAEFCTTGTVVKSVASRARWVQPVLSDLGLEPVFLTTGARRASIWRRSDIPENLRELMVHRRLLEAAASPSAIG